MKKFLFIICVVLGFAGTAFAQDTYVNGYYRKDGTYVQGHYKSPSNDYFYDNYSSSGNRNPYTGEKGYKKYPKNPYGY
ncbi:hypothetical protein B0D78_02610 [Pyramidobacter sp. C12-8]|nr:hypothetical protein B0D78_02610 [Pyramidobacter sp. C12-8]